MRKTAAITITDEGRDQGKVFVITEMPARVAEKWATKAFMALARSGVEVPDNLANAGYAGLAVLGFQALSHAKFEDVEPLLDEMMECVQVRPDPRHPDIVRYLVEDDIEEIATRLKLRMEVFVLHTGFSIPGVNSNSSISAPTPVDSPSTKTSPPSLARRSPPGKRRS